MQRLIPIVTILLMAGLAAQAKSMAYSREMGYMSAKGRIRLIAFQQTGQWLDYDQAAAEVEKTLPRAFSLPGYKSKKGFVRYLCYRFFTHTWVSDEDALAIAGYEMQKRQAELNRRHPEIGYP